VGVRGPHADAAVERHMVVVRRVKLDHRHWVHRIADSGVVGPLYRRNRTDLWSLAGEAPAHHRAVGHARSKDAPRIDARLPLHPVDHLANEADVVDIVLLRPAAAGPRVPGGEDAAGKAAV